MLDQYEALKLGIADASNVVLAAYYDTTKILTLDERDFRAVTPLTEQEAFTILPANA